MGTLVLRSPNPLHRHRLLPPSNPSPRPNQSRPHPRKRTPTAGRGNLGPKNRPSSPGESLVMGQVRILKRGEDLRSVLTTVATPGGTDDLALSSTGWIGPNPDVVRQHLRVSDLYAGAACLPSPPPSSLPFPAALVRSDDGDAAASDLRRLLRI